MKSFLKTFITAFLGFTVVFSGAFIALDRFVFNEDTADSPYEVTEDGAGNSKNLDQYLKSGNRLNVLLLGADGGRSDTMMIMSLGLVNKDIKLLSIPRDTYYHLEGYDDNAQRKINAIYGHGKEKGGAKGVKTAIEDLTKLEIPYYVEVNYDAVMEIVDLIGGVEFEVPFDMNYDDPYADPPLKIHLKKGLQVLDGEKSMQLIRWRKNNGSEGTGDIDRIKRQQDFMTAAVKKAFGLKLPMVIKAAYENINTNLSVKEMVYLGTKMLGVDLSTMEKNTLPGNVDMKNGYSYMMPDEAAIQILIETYRKSETKK